MERNPQLNYQIERIRNNPNLIVALSQAVKTLLGKPHRITKAHLRLAWPRLEDIERDIFSQRHLLPTSRPTHAELAQQYRRSQPGIHRIERRAIECLALEIWAAITGFSGLDRSVLIVLQRLGFTGPSELPQRCHDLIDASNFGQVKFKNLEAWLVQNHPGIKLREMLSVDDLRPFRLR